MRTRATEARGGGSRSALRQLKLASGICLTLLFAIGSPAAAVEPYLVKDINDVFVPADSDPEVLSSFGGLVLFTADDLYHGRELWRTDGTPGGTYRLLDACPDECSGGGRRVAATPDGLFFETNGELGRPQLWYTRGDLPSTVQLAGDFIGIGTAEWSASSRKLIFFASTENHYGAPWVTDGTPAGTHLLADPFPGSQYTGSGEPVPFRGGVLFTSGPGLWLTDGSAAGTRPVRLWPDDGVHFVRRLRVVGAVAIFVLQGLTQAELWKSDGTLAGTTMVYRFDAASTVAGDPYAVGNRYYFALSNYFKGAELWVSDGNPRGTRVLTALNPRNPFGDFLKIFVMDKRAVFVADDGRGYEPWVTDGTPRGTKPFADVCRGPDCSGLGLLGVLGKRVLAITSDPAGRQRLWVADGTAAGTRSIAELCPERCGAPRLLATIGDRALLLTYSHGAASLWVTNGTSGGTTVVRSFTNVGDVFGRQPVLMGGKAYFAAAEEHDGMELWRTDGTSAGTEEIVDVAPGTSAGSNPSAFAAAGRHLFFYSHDGEHGNELWTSEGSPETTRLVYEDAPGEDPVQPPYYVRSFALGETLIFQNDRDGRLWRSDGSPAGTYRLSPEGVTLDPDGVVLGGRAYLRGLDEQHGWALWSTDGTTAGTRLAVTTAGALDSAPGTLAVYGSRMLYWTVPGFAGWELWTSDGTAAGTQSVSALVPALGNSIEAGALTAGIDGVYFQVLRPTRGVELWRSDGTAAGTRLVSDDPAFPSQYLLRDGARMFTFGSDLGVTDGTPGGTARLLEGIGPKPLAAVGGIAYFTASSCAPPCFGDDVLWRSDGTTPGTYPVLDGSGDTIQSPRSGCVLAGQLVFVAHHGASAAVWVSDGTPAGTDLVRRLGTFTDSGPLLKLAGDRVYFAGSDPVHGTELWALQP